MKQDNLSYKAWNELVEKRAYFVYIQEVETKYIFHMKDILITDTHFGAYNNSMTWWKHQADFIYNQFIPFVKAQGDCNIIHLGDLLDIRS